VKKLRVLGVGAGYFSQFQYLGWQRIERAECVAIVNRDGAKARALADRFGVPQVYADLDAAIDAERPDLVDIITPPPTHRDFVASARRPLYRAARPRCGDPLFGEQPDPARGPRGRPQRCGRRGPPFR
jgi:hypothetical protein